MKLGRVNPILVVAAFAAVGAAVFARLEYVEERDAQTQRMVRAGERIVNLVSIFPLNSSREDARRLFLKSIVENASRDGFLYLLVHAGNGEPIVELGPSEVLNRIPPAVHNGALSAAGYIRQRFRLDDMQSDVHEFSRPIIAPNGQGGTVRLGLSLPPVPPLTAGRLSSLGAVSFLMLATGILGYYFVVVGIRRVTAQSRQGGARTQGGTLLTGAEPDVSATGIVPLVERLDRSLNDLKQRLAEVAGDNWQLASKLGVAAFEKKQVLNVLDQLQQGILITDSRERVTYVNRFMLKLLQKEADAIVDRPFADATENGELAGFVADRGPAQQPQQKDLETGFPGAAASRVFRVLCRVLMAEDEAFEGKLVLAEDITARKAAGRAQEDFIARVAHELMTPLTSLKAYSEMLADGELDDQLRHEFYNTINSETDRLILLITNLLNASKIELGSLMIAKELIRTDLLIEDCLPAVEAAAKEKHLTLQRLMPDNFPTLMGDKELLKIVLVNILGNAVKYTPEEGSITLKLSQRNGSAIFEVSDTGHGIPAEDLPHVFEQFYRGASAAVKQQTGSGLGLSTAAQIVKLHGGTIEVDSEVDKGSCFTVKVPIVEYTLENEHR